MAMCNLTASSPSAVEMTVVHSREDAKFGAKVGEMINANGCALRGFFFFSSRRRHTRYIGDWSSDVCSSDLTSGRPRGDPIRLTSWPRIDFHWLSATADGKRLVFLEATSQAQIYIAELAAGEIGRASCRERV